MDMSQRTTYVKGDTKAEGQGERRRAAEAGGERAAPHQRVHEAGDAVAGHAHQLHQVWMRELVEHAPLGLELISCREPGGRSHGLILFQPLDSNVSAVGKSAAKHGSKAALPDAIVFVEVVGGASQNIKWKRAQAVILGDGWLDVDCGFAIRK